ncbi:MAG: RNA 2',3'-cyclic phosphodiesterase [Methylobacteriaceae bacterium]|nr:RNA 2',3'-cyclic phosphodiesterase [Methylobacteriaceae bacterium]
MPRLFTGLEIPPAIAETLARLRGGLAGARWIEPENFHITLRFIGDIDFATARDVASVLGESRPRDPMTITIDGLGAFGGAKPRALVAKVAPSPELIRLQAEQERLMQRIGLEPEPRKYTPHVTLARFRAATASEVAGILATRGPVAPLTFAASRFVLYSARDSVGGGPYLVEAAYPFAGQPPAREPAPGAPPGAGAPPVGVG